MRVLVVEDDPGTNKLVSAALARAGYVVESAIDGEHGYYLGDVTECDAVILDIGLPLINGTDVLRKWRKSGKRMPVLILTGDDSSSRKVSIFDGGADDYLTKPFEMPELLARVRALIRRSNGFADAVLVSGEISFDARSGTVTRSGTSITLPRLEQRLLHFLLHRAGSAVSRTELIEHIYAQDMDRDSNTLEVFIRRLRVKLGANAIETVRGQGYRMPVARTLIRNAS